MRQAVSLFTPGPSPKNSSEFEHLDLIYDKDDFVLWKFIKADSTPYFSAPQLDDIRDVQNAIAEGAVLPVEGFSPDDLRYVVFGSRVKGIFSLGGDLKLFRDLIERRDRTGLASYAKRAADAVYFHATNARSITTISLVQGAAMGGGFEAALAGNVIVAERGTRLGFPEVLFGLFPGMGAYTLLRRRVTAALAEEIILSADNFSAESLSELGVIDILADPGEGEAAVRSYISKHRSKPGYCAFRRALNRTRPVDHDELYFLADEWVDAAMRLDLINLRRIDRLVRGQERLKLRTEDALHKELNNALPNNVVIL